MKRKKYIIKFIHLIFISQVTIFNCLSQDIHFSQFNSSPQIFNPSSAGLFDGDLRIVGNQKSQWAAIPVPYKTYAIAVDKRFNKKKTGITPALGLLINTDKAGDSKFRASQFFLSAAIIKNIGKDSTHFISIGLQPGFTTKSFKINELTFDNQYDGDNYNPALSSGEDFGKYRITYLDLGTGLTYLWMKSKRTQFSLGFSAFHINMPKQSFFNDNNIRLDIKTVISGNVAFPIAQKLDLIPSFLNERQGKYKETILGLFGKYYLQPINGMTTAISEGSFYRLKDSFIFAANLDYRSFIFGLSYDINTSKLIEATNNKGGFEISIIYIFKKAVPYVAKKRACPIYM